MMEWHYILIMAFALLGFFIILIELDNDNIKPIMTDENIDTLGRSVDRLESLTAGLQIPLPPEMHIDQLKKILPEISEALKQIYIAETGVNEWE